MNSKHNSTSHAPFESECRRRVRLIGIAAMLAFAIGVVVIPFVVVPPSHVAVKKLLRYNVWLSCMSRATDEGTIIRLKGPVKDSSGEDVVCPSCGKPFVWATEPASGEVMMFLTIGSPETTKRMYFVKCPAPDASGKRWYLFNDGQVKYLSETEVDSFTQMQK